MSNKKGKNLELKKPSELCHVLYYSDFNKNEFATLTPVQIDIISTMFYFVSDVMSKQDLTEEEIYEWASVNHFEINLQSIAEILGKYENRYYEPIVKNLQELSKIQVLTNTLHKNKTQESTLFHFLRKISWSKDKQTTSKRVKVWIEPELLIIFLNLKNYYTKISLQIQFGLKSKYSKLLYELLKDYVGSGSKSINFDILKATLNVNLKDKPQLEKWSIFNRDILKKAVKEINEISDIKVEYSPIKERIEKKLTVTNVSFTISEQKSVLLDYDNDERSIELDTKIVSNSEPQDKSIEPIEQKYLEIAKKRLEKAKEFNDIRNEQNYIIKIIENLKEEKIDVVNMIKIDEFLDSIKADFSDLKNEKHQLIVFTEFPKCRMVAINNQYLLYSPMDGLLISESIEDTINKINQYKNESKEILLTETNSIIQDLSISYL